MDNLKSILQQIDGKGYKSYKKTAGIYQFPEFSLKINHVQGDPFAIPSRISVRVPHIRAGFPLSIWQESWTGKENNPIRRIAMEDYLGRVIKKNIQHIIKGHRGSGGLISIESSGQKTLLRNAVLIKKDYIEARLLMGLPADNRHVSGLDAQQMFFDELTKIIAQSLYYKNCSKQQLLAHINSIEDHDALRHSLKEKNLAAFIANGSQLPRQSGISDKPMQGHIINFQSPASLEVKISLPNTGSILGMGIPQGISLIAGGGFHGKSTLLNALVHDPYNHIPGDGREKVVTDETAVKIRSEDGRVISKVNISPFIDHLPFGCDTHQFSTENASGSTSQAANIIEALECGSKLLLIDEDTSANNFMIRDKRMQALVSQDKEPITPLLYRVRELYEQHNVSSIIVMGGSGDYFDVADTVIMMDEYKVKDVTAQAKKIARNQHNPSVDELENLPSFQRTSTRKPGKKTLDASRDQFAVRINAGECTNILYGKYKIDLSLVEQLIDIGQTRTIGLMIYYYACHYAHTSGSLTEQLKKLLKEANNKGLDIFSPYMAILPCHAYTN